MTTPITVANQEWTILSGIATALSAATVGGATVFKTVTVTASPEQARECQFKGTAPIAIVRYIGTDEKPLIEGEAMGVASVEVIVATKKDRGVDESLAVQEGLRLINAVKNAVAAGPPTVAYAVGTDGQFAYACEWGSPRIETNAGDSDAPWITATIPVKFGMNFGSGTSH